MRVLVVALVALTGCSLFVTRSHPNAAGRCAGLAPPIIDAVATATLTTLAVLSYRENHCDNVDGCHNYDPTGLYVLPTIGFAASTAWGVSGAQTCARAAR